MSEEKQPNGQQKKDSDKLPKAAGKILEGGRYPCSFEGVKFFKRDGEKRVRIDVVMSVTPEVLKVLPDGIRDSAERVKELKFDKIAFETEFENRFVSIYAKPKGAADVEADKITIRKVRLESGEKFESVFLSFQFETDDADAHWWADHYDSQALIQVMDAQLELK